MNDSQINRVAIPYDYASGDRNQGLKVVEGAYNALHKEYSTFAATHDAAATQAWMKSETQDLVSKSMIGNLSVIWAEQQAMKGEPLDEIGISNVAFNKDTDTFDKAMSQAFLGYYMVEHHEPGNELWTDFAESGDLTKELKVFNQFESSWSNAADYQTLADSK